MKRTIYNSREEAERLNPYVILETPNYEGRKCGIAQIVYSFSSKKAAENKREQQGGGKVMTRKQAEKFIQRWNSEYQDGNLAINF
jgi:hypothetical protein